VGKLVQLQRKGSGPRAGSWAEKMKKEAALVEERVGLGRNIRAGPQGETARRKKKKKKMLWAVLGWFSYFLSLSYFFSFQTSLKLIEFKL
jgi:hypothetical protein